LRDDWELFHWLADAPPDMELSTYSLTEVAQLLWYIGYRLADRRAAQVPLARRRTGAREHTPETLASYSRFRYQACYEESCDQRLLSLWTTARSPD